MSVDKLEKVIKGLECCAECGKCKSECPYDGKDNSMYGCTTRLAQDALELLKAQEPVKPKKNDVEFAGLRTWDWACPECNCTLEYRANYCSCCGRAVKWE